MFGIKEAATRLLQLQSFLPSTFHFVQNSSIASAMNSDVQRIHEFWYTRNPMEWFFPPEGFDEVCNREFGSLIQKARTGELDDWVSEPKSTLALLVLLDQFPRNIYRGTSEAFSSDTKAFDIATKSIAKGWDKEVPPLQAATFYLPIIHSESLISKIAGVMLYEQWVSRSPEGSDNKEFFQSGLTSAILHRDVIQKFGRYPARNKALGRQSTKEEEEFLKENPSGFPSGGPIENDQ